MFLPDLLPSDLSPSDLPEPAGSLVIPRGEPNPRAVPDAIFTAELEAPTLAGLHGLILLAVETFGDPERVLAIRLDDAALTAELDFGPRGSGRPAAVH